jgi:hypothetical protein
MFVARYSEDRSQTCWEAKDTLQFVVDLAGELTLSEAPVADRFRRFGSKDWEIVLHYAGRPWDKSHRPW